jgi:hypothetical protein
LVLTVSRAIDHSYFSPKSKRCSKVAQRCDRMSNLVIRL